MAARELLSVPVLSLALMHPDTSGATENQQHFASQSGTTGISQTANIDSRNLLAQTGASAINADRSVIRNSPYFNQHKHVDCHDDMPPGDNFWPKGAADCLFGDAAKLPSLQDTAILPSRANYGKHLTPTDAVNLQFPEVDDSLSSIIIGLEEDGPTGTHVTEVSIYIHPRAELPIIVAHGQDARARHIVDGFLESTTGQPVDDQVAIDLYDAALHCGDNSLDGTQRGRSRFIPLGSAGAIVELSDRVDTTAQDRGPFSNGRDCDIRIAALP